MKKIPNQKIVTISKEKVEKNTGKSKPFLIAYVDTIERASRDLKGNAFKVYMYLLTNLDDYRFGLSPQDIANRYGISPDSARDNIEALVDAHYLVHIEGDEYTFYDNIERQPIKLPNELSKQLETKVFVDESGNKYTYTFKQILEMVEDEERARQIWEGNE